MTPLLYVLAPSPPANAVRMLADIIGLQLDLKEIDFLSMEHKSPEYLKINPLGTVPTLQDGDFILTDSHAIMKYLLSKYGGDNSETLYPSDVRTRALVDQAMFFNVGVFFIKIKIVTLPSLFEDLTGPTEKHKEEIDGCYSVCEAWLENRKYIAADHLTIGDLSLGATAFAMQPIHKLDSKKFPLTAAWLSRLGQEKFFQSIIVPGTAIFEQILNASWEKNKQNNY